MRETSKLATVIRPSLLSVVMSSVFLVACSSAAQPTVGSPRPTASSSPTLTPSSALPITPTTVAATPVALAPAGPATTATAIAQHLQQALADRDRGDDQAAIKEFDAVLAVDPSNAEAQQGKKITQYLYDQGDRPVTPVALPPTPNGRRAGYGATSAEWDASHHQDTTKAIGSGYDPVNGTDRYAAVLRVNGRVFDYIMQFKPPISAAAAKKVVADELPPDATVQSDKVTDQCELMVFKSQYVEQEWQRAGVLVIVSLDSDALNTYDPRAVDTVYFVTPSPDASLGC